MSNTSHLAELYQSHHESRGRLGFSILEKERADWIIRHTPKGGVWLDLGCRDGTLTKHFVDRVDDLVGVDIDPTAIERAKHTVGRGSFFGMDLLGDWSELEDRKFDVILCSEVLEHVYQPEIVVSKIIQHLKPGGRFVGTVPNAFFLKHRFRYLLGQRACTPLEDPTHITQFNAQHLKWVLTFTQTPVTLVLEGYTRPPFRKLASIAPSMFAYNFLFEVHYTEIVSSSTK